MNMTGSGLVGLNYFVEILKNEIDLYDLCCSKSMAGSNLGSSNFFVDSRWIFMRSVLDSCWILVGFFLIFVLFVSCFT